MSDAAGTHNDNGLPFGSQQLTFSGANTPFIADNIDFDRPVKILTGTNEFDVPYREVLIEGVWTASATLQVPTPATPPPTIGSTVDIKEVGGATLHAKVSKVGGKFKKDGETLVPVEMRQRFATGA